MSRAVATIVEPTSTPDRRTRIRIGAIGLGAAILLAVLLIDIATGPSGLPVREAIPALLAGPHGGDRLTATILWQLRMPEAFMGLLVGMALGVSGLQMQTILDNPLASPFTLGFSAAAGFGAALAILFGMALPVADFLLVPLCAFAMTLVAAGIIYLVARVRGATPEVLVLAGIAVLFFFQSLQSFLQYMASPEVLQQIVFWLFGSLQKATWTSVLVILLITTVAIPFIVRDTWNLTALRLGDANASSLGLNTDALRRRTFLFSALLTAAAVSFTGTIGFVGLIAPHAARAIVGEDHRFSLPLSAICGAIILTGASVFGKAISPGGVIPVGIVTAVTGVPTLFAIITFGGGRRQR